MVFQAFGLTYLLGGELFLPLIFRNAVDAVAGPPTFFVGAALRDRAIRAVLASWDFRDPEGWQAVLGGSHRDDLGEVFRAFAGTRVFRQLGKARECRRDVEYLLPLAASPLVVRGVIDCLWQDDAGGWHVLDYDTSAGSEPGRRKRTQTVRIRLVLAALAAEALVGVVPGIKFGLAFCEASGKCLVRWSGTDPAMTDLAKKNAAAIGAGHSFIVFLGDGFFPLNVLNTLKMVPEVCRIFCATANPTEVVLAETEQGRGILGVVDGFSPKGVEDEGDIKWRKDFLRKIGYKL